MWIILRNIEDEGLPISVLKYKNKESIIDYVYWIARRAISSSLLSRIYSHCGERRDLFLATKAKHDHRYAEPFRN